MATGCRREREIEEGEEKKHDPKATGGGLA
jgi:hypothetical protein